MKNVTMLTGTTVLFAILTASTAFAGGDSVVLSKGISTVENNTVTIEKGNVRQYRQDNIAQYQKKSDSKFYRVHAGDTLSAIAKRFNVSLQRLVVLNKLYGNKKDQIQVGQLLQVR